VNYALFYVFIFLFFGTNSLIAADGKALYIKNCQSCHGADAAGKPALEKTLKLTEGSLNLVDDETLKKPDAELAEAILNGYKKMKAIKNITADDASAIVKHIRSLKK